jgi:voltage-gated potassium channel Kch
VFYCYFRLGFIVALLSCLYLRFHENDVSAHFFFAYTTWGQAIVFGVVLGLLVQKVLDRQNPERWCRLMAQLMRNHFVIVGYSHLGSRLVRHLRQQGFPYVLIEKDRDKVDELLAAHEPVIVDDAREEDALQHASIAEAKAVIIASNNVETALLVTKKVRDTNKACGLIVRCFHDELAEVLEALGATHVISSSKTALEEIIRHLDSPTPPQPVASEHPS